jgi:hypothetical protein
MLSNNNDYDIYELVKKIHKFTKENNKRFVIAPTGGGISSLSYLLSQPGASSTILECTVPYATESSLEYINTNNNTNYCIDDIDSFVSIDTTNKLSDAASFRCLKLLIDSNNTSCQHIGIGATANLVSNGNWKRGMHCIYVSIKSNNCMINFHMKLYKGEHPLPFRTRQEEDEICGKLIVCVCAYECKILNDVSLKDFMNNNGLDSRDELVVGNNLVHELLNEKIKNVLCHPRADGSFLMIPNFKFDDVQVPLVMLPGSFNPLHDGHANALKHTIKLVDGSFGMYELSVKNATKPTLKYDEVMSRLNNFRGQKYSVLLTIDAPLFITKAQNFPNTTFAMGIDTLLRLFDPQFGDLQETVDDFKEITEKGARFIVFPRIISSANISVDTSDTLCLSRDAPLSLNMVKDIIPAEVLKCFIEVSNNKYMDVSSSKLRA